MSLCWTHGLLFVVGAMCSPVYCLSPPILLTNHCFSCSTCVSRYPRLSPYLASWCLQSCADLLSYVVCVCWVCTALCLSVFPFGVVFVLFFISLLKRHFSCILSPRLIYPHVPWHSWPAAFVDGLIETLETWELNQILYKMMHGFKALKYCTLRKAM